MSDERFPMLVDVVLEECLAEPGHPGVYRLALRFGAWRVRCQWDPTCPYAVVVEGVPNADGLRDQIVTDIVQDALLLLQLRGSDFGDYTQLTDTAQKIADKLERRLMRRGFVVDSTVPLGGILEPAEAPAGGSA